MSWSSAVGVVVGTVVVGFGVVVGAVVVGFGVVVGVVVVETAGRAHFCAFTFAHVATVMATFAKTWLFSGARQVCDFWFWTNPVV